MNTQKTKQKSPAYYSTVWKQKAPPLKGKPTTLPTNLQLNMEMLVHYKHEPTISPFLDEFS